jgi:LysM repeat protein
METRRRSPLRLLAPVALIAFALALFLIVSSANKDSGGGGAPSKSAAEKARDLGSPATQRKPKRKSRSSDNLPQRIYIVKSGDTLGSIAQTTGVPVQKLQDLNPGLDQFSLVAGQKIKLR